MSDYKNNDTIEKSSPKSFGIVFSIVFFIIGVYPIFYSNNLRYWSLILSILLLLTAFIFPKILVTPNNFWFKFGIILNRYVSYIVLLIIYIGVLCPTGLIIRIMGKDQLKLKKNKDIKTYWTKRIDQPGEMDNLF